MSGEAEGPVKRPEWLRKQEKKLRKAPVRKLPKSHPSQPETIPPSVEPYPEGEEEPRWLKELRKEPKAEKPPQKKLWPFNK